MLIGEYAMLDGYCILSKLFFLTGLGEVEDIMNAFGYLTLGIKNFRKRDNSSDSTLLGLRDT